MMGDALFRQTGGDMASYGDDELVKEYAEGIAIGVSAESVAEAIKDGYEKLSRRGKQPPYQVLETWAHGTNPFTEFRVVMRG